MTLSWLAAPLRALRALRRSAASALAAALASALVACGGGGYLPSPLSVTDHRPLSADFTSRKAASYSPYRDAECDDKTNPANAPCLRDLSDEVITAENVLQDLRLVEGAGIGLIRLFSSARFGETVLSTIRANGLNLKVMLGAYVYRPDSADIEAVNQAELQSTIDLANRYSDIVLAVSVGNETMVDFSFLAIPPATMGRYIKQVRDAITQPITTDDNWYFWATAPTVVLDVVDFAAVHTYPLLDTFYDPTRWDWRFRDVPADQRAAAMMDGAIAEAKRQVGAARAYLDRIGLADMPIVIGETGWTAVDYNGDPALNYRAGPVNQKMYVDRLQAWAGEPASNGGPVSIIYFQSFDEQWKRSDDGWGLFTRDRKARCVVQTLNPPSATWVYDTSSSCDLAAAVYFDPPVPTDPLPASTTRYVLYSDAPLVQGDEVAVGQVFNPFAATFGPETSATFAPDGGSKSIEITPNPANYGWGFFQSRPTVPPAAPGFVSVNLSGFEQGAVNVWIRTDNYPGKLEIGIWSDSENRDQKEAYVQIESGQYGYSTDNQWHLVSIPVSAFLVANPDIDLSLITSGFVISDIFERTGKPLNTTGLPKVYVDGIAWTR